MSTKKTSDLAHHTKSFGDFTESAYRDLVCTAKKNWQFIQFPDHAQAGRTILWRHDVDFSLHRALALAKIEREEGVRATYFILLTGSFYNPLEKETAQIVRSIADMGHAIGLHFDPVYYGKSFSSREDLERALIFEGEIVEKVSGTRPKVFSWHNPTSGDWLTMKEEIVAGMLNAYCGVIGTRYRYVSDSNGIWRHDRLQDVLKDSTIESLHVLTHPAWWVPEPLAPRERIQRTVNGRARRTMERYDEDLKRFSRPNIDGEK